MSIQADHASHAVHNEDFYTNLCAKFEGKFPDWKITVNFYTAYHWLKGLAAAKGLDIGNNHGDIRQNIMPGRYGSMEISRGAYRLYDYLYTHSQKARYMDFDFTDYETFLQIMENDIPAIEKALSNFKSYLESVGEEQGYKCSITETKTSSPTDTAHKAAETS